MNSALKTTWSWGRLKSRTSACPVTLTAVVSWCLESPSGHSGGRTHQQLPWNRSEGQVDWAAAASATAAGPGGADPERAELPEGPWEHRCIFVLSPLLSLSSVYAVSRGAFSHDEWEHQPACPVVVHRSDAHPRHHRHLADETSKELLRGQETGVGSMFALSNVIMNSLEWMWMRPGGNADVSPWKLCEWPLCRTDTAQAQISWNCQKCTFLFVFSGCRGHVVVPGHTGSPHHVKEVLDCQTNPPLELEAACAVLSPKAVLFRVWRREMASALVTMWETIGDSSERVYSVLHVWSQFCLNGEVKGQTHAF